MQKALSQMQMQSGKRLHSGQRDLNSGTRRHGFAPDANLSQTPTYSTRSPSRHQGMPLRLTSSVKAAAREAAGTFLTCFSPQHRRAFKGDVHGGSDLYEAKEISFSFKDFTGSKSNSSNKFKYSISYDSDSAEMGALKFSVSDIYKATGNFSSANKIGQGGFGTVYKGVLKDGTAVAVKRAKKTMHDRRASTEFRNEIETLSQVEHLNLVRFLGYLEHGDEKIIVEEYVSNGTLKEHLHGKRGNGLDLAQRLDIAIDVAHAVTYLHMYTDHPIIHRDIKASNILITEKVRAKVADFGFARLNVNDSGATHISSEIKGTTGYLDPEYLKTYQLTEKSDVYSFGVLLIELMTGRRPIEPKRELKERVTARWALQKLKEGDAVLAMDLKLKRSHAANAAVEKVLQLATECLAPSRRSRPSMKKCAEVLWEIRKNYREIEFSSSSSHPGRYFMERIQVIQ